MTRVDSAEICGGPEVADALVAFPRDVDVQVGGAGAWAAAMLVLWRAQMNPPEHTQNGSDLRFANSYVVRRFPRALSN